MKRHATCWFLQCMRTGLQECSQEDLKTHLWYQALVSCFPQNWCALSPCPPRNSTPWAIHLRSWASGTPSSAVTSIGRSSRALRLRPQNYQNFMEKLIFQSPSFKDFMLSHHPPVIPHPPPPPRVVQKKPGRHMVAGSMALWARWQS